MGKIGLGLILILLLAAFAYSEEHPTEPTVEEPEPESPVEEPPVENPPVEEPGEEVSDVNIIVPLEPETPDINVGDDLIEDFNDIIPGLIFISPIEFQILNEIEILIVSLQDFDGIISHWFILNGIQFESDLAGNTITTDINTLEFDDGVYDLEANACTESACFSETISITIENDLVEDNPPDTNESILDVNTSLHPEENPEEEPGPDPEPESESEEELFSVVPSNVFAALSVFDLNETLIDSSTEEVLLGTGTYNATLTVLETPVNSIIINELIIDSSVVLIEIDDKIPLGLVVPDANLLWVEIVSLKPNSSFTSADFEATVSGNVDFVYECNFWDFGAQTCNGSWELFGYAKTGQMQSKVFSSGNAFGFAKIIQEGDDVNRVHVPVDDPSLVIVPSNIPANLSISYLDGVFLGAGETVNVWEETYDAELTFSNSSLNTLSLNDVVLDSNTLVVEVSEITGKNSLVKIDPNYLSLIALKVNPVFSNSSVSFNLPNNFENLLQCNNWDFVSQTCNDSWVDLNFTSEATFNSNSVAFGFSRKKIPKKIKEEYDAEVLYDANYLLEIKKIKKLKKAKNKLKDEPIPDTSNIDPTGKRLFSNSSCGETFYSEINDNGYVYRLENECLIVDFKESLENTRIYSNNTSQIVGVTPIGIEEINSNGDIVGFVNFTESPFKAVFKEKENILNDVGFEKGRISWSFNYGGGDVHIYYKLVRDYLKWGLEIEDWNYTSSNNLLRLKHVTAGNFEAVLYDSRIENPDKPSTKTVFLTDLTNNSVATINFLDPTNSGLEYDSKLSLDVNGNTVFIYQTLGNGPLIELDPTLNLTTANDGFITRDDGVPRSVSPNNIIVGYDRRGPNNDTERGIFSFDITGLGSITTGIFALDFEAVLIADASGTFDLLSITDIESPSAGIDDGDYDSSSFETITDNWFDCSTIVADINTDVVTAWNNSVTASRVYFDLRLFLDDDTSRNGNNVECEVDFFDTGEAGDDPNIFFTVPAGNLEFSITNPPADNNTTVNQDVDFLVNGTTTCRDSACGSVDTNVQYCIGAGCTGWLDLNTVSSSPMYIVSGSQPQNNASLAQDASYNVSWVLQSTVAQTYELRFRGDGTTADANTTNGTDRTITIQAAANDFSFTLSLPSSGCTQGEGSDDAGADCERGYFETTDLTGLATETEVDAQGQSTNPFFVFDNQSSTSSDFNITLDLNAALPGTLELKASNVETGWESTCGGIPLTGCVDITTSAPSVGTALYTTGTLDLNIFFWADFTSAGILVEDRNVDSTGISPT